MVYHGVRETVAGGLYRAGLALLDLERPSRVLHRSDEWVLSPQAPFEVSGDVPNVVFPCGLVHDESTDVVSLYCGAADTRLATANRSMLLESQGADRGRRRRHREPGWPQVVPPEAVGPPEAPPLRHSKERATEIPKDKILELLRSRGDNDKADQADNELPDQVDTERDSGLLSKFGIDPSELLGKFGGGKIPGL